jgi:hypothetical protein
LRLDLVCKILKQVGAAGTGDYGNALSCQLLHQVPADAAGGTGDDGTFVLKISVRHSQLGVKLSGKLFSFRRQLCFQVWVGQDLEFLLIVLVSVSRTAQGAFCLRK